MVMLSIGIIVDMQNDFVNPGGALFSKEGLALVAPMVRFVREHSFDKLYALLDTHQPDYLSTQEGQKLPVTHCISGEWGHELHEAIQQLPLDARICKPTFGYVNWVSFLTQEGIIGNYPEQDLCFTLMGVDTDICVISNALILKAFFREAQINVVASLCAGTTKENHSAALAVMRSCQIDLVGVDGFVKE